MLKKKYRLPVQSVIGKKGLSRRGRYFLVKIFPPERDHSRVGVVVSARVAPKATARNRLRRQVYDLAAPLLHKLPVQDYLIITQPTTAHSINSEQVLDGMIKELRSLISNNQLTGNCPPKADPPLAEKL